MSKVIELINSIFKKEEVLLDDRFEFRLNSKEKQLKKYCDLKHISASEFFRSLAMKEIDNFIRLKGRECICLKIKKSQYKNKTYRILN